MKRSAPVLISIIVFLLALGYTTYGQDKITARDEPVPKEKLDIFLVMDNSGSMKINDPKFLTREVVTNFLKNIGEESRLGMVIFDRTAVLAEPLTQVTDAKARGKFLKSLAKVNYKGRWTNSPAGIERAIYELKTNGRKDVQKVIIFLTDGIVDTGKKSDDFEKLKWLKEDLAEDSKKSGIRIFAIAFTEKADFSLIQTLAHKTDGQYFRAYKAEEIEGIFTKINEAIKKIRPQNIQTGPVSPLTSTTQSRKQTQKQDHIDIPLPVILGGAAAILVIFIVFLLFRKKSKPRKDEQLGKPFSGDKEEPPMPQAELIDEQSIISKHSIKIEKRIVRIGRDLNNDIIIPKKTISALHATITYEKNGYYLEDQRSSNYTRLNDKKVKSHTPIRLKSGDVITFDVYRFRFILPFQALSGETVLHRIEEQPEASKTIIRKLEDLEKDIGKPLSQTKVEQPGKESK